MTLQARWQSESSVKATYHHGNLRDALVKAARQLVDGHGSEHFKLADACRLAGVSTAAPYRHFANKEELLDAVVLDGFHALTVQTRNSAQHHSAGSVEAIAACGKAYVSFAKSHPNLFRVMFGRSVCDSSEAQREDPEAQACTQAYRVLLEQLAARLSIQIEDAAVEEQAFPLWTFVHGLSFIVIDNNLGICEQSIDINKLIDVNTVRLLTTLTVASLD